MQGAGLTYSQTNLNGAGTTDSFSGPALIKLSFAYEAEVQHDHAVYLAHVTPSSKKPDSQGPVAGSREPFERDSSVSPRVASLPRIGEPRARRPDAPLPRSTLWCEVRRRADLIVVAAPSVQEAYRTQAMRLAIVHDGRVVVRNERIVDE